MRIFLALLIIALGWIMQGCTNEADRNAIRQMEQAAPLMQSDPEAAHVLLADSVAHPELLSPEVNARWCLMLCQLADSIGTPLPYVPQMERAYRYMKRHGTIDEQLQAALYLGRTYMDDQDQEAALRTYTEALQQSIMENKPNQSGYISSYMGDVYQFQGMYQQAVEKYLTASRYFRKAGNHRSQAFAFRDASRNYAFMDSLDIALTYMLHADSMVVLYGDSMDRAGTLNGLGNIYREKGNYPIAEYYLKRAIQLDSTCWVPNNLALADLYLEQSNLKDARKCLERISHLSSDQHVPVDWFYLSFLLNKEEGSLQEALDALEQYVDAVYEQLEVKNKTNLIETEKKHNYTKLLIHLSHLKTKQRVYVGCSVVVCLFLIICIVLYRLKLKSRQLILVQKENEMNALKNQLRNREKEMSAISEQLQRQTDLLNQRMEQLYRQKEQEVESIRQQIGQKNQEMLEKAAITQKVRKLSEKVVPNATKSPLSAKDWAAAYELIDTIYPSISGVVAIYDLTEKEKMVCYLTLFNLSANAEAVLMNQPLGSINKYRQTLRKKLQINDRNIDLYDFLSKMM